MALSNKKIILIICSAAILFAVGIGSYLILRQKFFRTGEINNVQIKRNEANNFLGKWISEILKKEFVPPDMAVQPGMDLYGEINPDAIDTFGYNWEFQGKKFHAAINYNKTRAGINNYILSVIFQDTANFNATSAKSILEKFFNFPAFEAACEKNSQGVISVNICKGNWVDEKGNFQMAYALIKGEKDIFLIYYSTPPESENYGKELGQQQK